MVRGYGEGAMVRELWCGAMVRESYGEGAMVRGLW